MLGVAVFGMITSSCPSRCCLVFYIIIGIVLTIVQLIIVLVMIINPEKVVNSLVSACNSVNSCYGLTSDRQRVSDIVYTGRWVLLGWVCAQAICLILAIMMSTCCGKRRRRYNEFEDDPEVASARERLRAVQMQNVAMEQRAGGTAKAGTNKGTPLAAHDYNTTAADIAARYNMQPQGYDSQQQFMTVPQQSPAAAPPMASTWGASGKTASAPKSAW